MADGPPSGDLARVVPWRTIFATLAVVVGAYVGYLLVRELSRIIAWVAVAGFFTVVLAPAVDGVQRRLHLRRTLATALVFFAGLALVVGMLYLFIRPVVEQASGFVDDLPDRVEEARDGRGPLGDIVRRYELDDWLDKNSDRIQESLRDAGTPALRVAAKVFSGLLGFLTIMVLTFLMLLRGPEISAGVLGLVPERHRERVRLIAADAAKAVSGYMLGNLLISLIAGLATYVVLLICGVPSPEVLALWVAFADLIPMVGATLGAIPTVLVAFLHSTPAGIAVLVFYVVYQQFENHVLQVTVMSRTVDVNPLTVLLSVLAGIELFGFLGALLAIPVAGVIQVVIRNVYDVRRGELKSEPTVGPEQVPVSHVDENGAGSDGSPTAAAPAAAAPAPAPAPAEEA